MSSTKEKILNASIELFNQKGFVNATLRDIAAEVGISTGNLAYHFKNKEVIGEHVYELLVLELREIAAGFKVLPSFEHVHAHILPVIQFQQKYQFFYLDTLEIERALPHIAKEYQKTIATQIDGIKAILDYNVGTGNLQTESYPSAYRQLAHSIWMTMAFWSSQQKIRGVGLQDEFEARTSIWNLVYPHFTKQGLQRYEAIVAQTQTHPKS